MAIEVRQARLRAGRFGLAALGAIVAAAEPTPPLTLSPEQSALFSLVDRFDTANTDGCPFVRVATGQSICVGSDPPRNTYRLGFLLAEDKDTFRVRYVDLTEGTLKKTAPGTPEDERVGYDAQDLETVARDVAARLWEDEDDGGPDWYLRPTAIMNPRAEALLLARLCARRGCRAGLDALWPEVVKEPQEHWLRRSEGLAGGLADGLRWHLCLDFADLSLTRAQLLERHRRWLEAFPDHTYHKVVEKDAAILACMVEEDRARQRRPPAADAAVGPESDAAIADLVFALRDQNVALGMSWIGSHNVVAGTIEADTGPSPAWRLQELGLRAVPALIAALDDDSFTRCVWYSSRHGGSFWVYPVQVFAEQILEEIAGMRRYGPPEERKRAWQQWWQEVQSQGEVAALAQVVGRGKRGCEGAARRLLERAPNRVEDVFRGIRHAETRGVRRDLVVAVGTVQDPRVTAFLLREVAKGPYSQVRVEAARALLEQGNRVGLERMVEQWRTTGDLREKPQPGVPRDVAEDDLRTARQAGWEALAGFLIGSGDIRAVEAVGKRLADQPAAVRRAVMDSLWGTALGDLLERAPTEARAAVGDQVEGILGALVHDDRECNGNWGVVYKDQHVRVQCPLVADLAACTMMEYWPDRYDYDPVGPPRLRQRRLAVLRNVWRGRQGLPLLPVPVVPDVRSRDPGIQAALTRVIAAPEATTRQGELAVVEKAGLGALPWIEDRLRELPADHPARADLRGLADRLSNIVRQAEFRTAGRKAIPALAAAVAATEGKPLEGTTLVGIMVAAAKALAKGCGDVTVRADRLGDGTGVTLEVEATAVSGRPEGDMGVSLSVQAGPRQVLSQGSGGGRDLGNDADDYAEARRAFDQALATPHDGTFEIVVGLKFR